MLLHVLRVMELVARIQKLFVIALADQRFEFGFGQPLRT